MTERRIEYLSLTDLLSRLHPANPKNHDIPLIAQSFREHGYGSSGMLDDRTGLILCGHGRAETLAWMKEREEEPPRYIENRDGEWYCPVERGYSSMNDSQALAYITIDNQSTIAGGWDNEALAKLLITVKESEDSKLTSTGFTPGEFDHLLQELDPANYVKFPEYDESIADTVEYHDCPNCGHKWPK